METISPGQKCLAISDQQPRMAILQSGERCPSGIGSCEALRTCMSERKGDWGEGDGPGSGRI